MTVLYIVVALALLAAVAVVLVKKVCHWWDCGSLKRAWKKREPNSDDYDLHTTNKLSEYDRYLTDVNEWRLDGEREVQENGRDDC